MKSTICKRVAAFLIFFICILLTSCIYREADLSEVTSQEILDTSLEETVESLPEPEAEPSVIINDDSPMDRHQWMGYSSEEDWHTPWHMYNRKFPFAIYGIHYSEDGETIYVLRSITREIYAIRTADGETLHVYQPENNWDELVDHDGVLYCISSEMVERWNTTTYEKMPGIPLTYEEPYGPLLIQSAAMVEDTLVLLHDNNTMRKIDVADGSMEIFHIGKEGIVPGFGEEVIGCAALDAPRNRVIIYPTNPEINENIVCYNLTTDAVIHIPMENKNTYTMMNPETGLLYCVFFDPDTYQTLCKTYDPAGNLVHDLHWTIEGISNIAFYPSDMNADDSLLLIQDDWYGRIFVMDMRESEKYLWIEEYVNDWQDAYFLNTECILFTGGPRQPWKLMQVNLNRYYYDFTEITGFLSLERDADSFVLYKDNGYIAVYSSQLKPNVASGAYVYFSTRPSDSSYDRNIYDYFEVITNPMPCTGGGMVDGKGIAAISPDERYHMEIWDEREEGSEEVKTSYWLTDQRGENEPFPVQFPEDIYFQSVAVKDGNTAALIDSLGTYYEFNPKNGEITKSGMLEIAPDADLYEVQLVVDFDDHLASVIYRYSNNGYVGALYSTETYKMVYDYGEAYPETESGVGHGYMMADVRCEKVYYKDGYAMDYLVLTIPDSIRK